MLSLLGNTGDEGQGGFLLMGTDVLIARSNSCATDHTINFLNAVSVGMCLGPPLRSLLRRPLCLGTVDRGEEV